MKRKITIGLLLLLTITSAVFFSFRYAEKEEFENDSDEEKEAGVDKQMAMWFQARAYPDPYYLNYKYQRAWEQAEAIRAGQDISNQAGRIAASAQWQAIGPNTGIGGRMLSIAINPVNSSNIIVGSAGGGMWRTYSGGATWQPVVTGFPVIGVSSVLINPVDTNVIYAGTGELYRLDSTGTTANPNTIGFNVWKTRGTYGIGILKSTDGGLTWTKALDKLTANMFAIQMLKFNPLNTNTVYACATDGLYRSQDAGATWNNILPKTYVSDVVINAKDTNQLVASVGNLQNTDKGIYRSTNGGSSWAKITSTAGLPSTFQGFIRLANIATRGNRDTIIASIGVSEATGVKEIYRSTNFGTTWTGLTNSTHTKWQYWCAHTVAINPSNTSKYILGGVKLYNFTYPSTVTQLTFGHDDIHDIKFDPTNSNTLYVACDGGMYKSTNGGTSFTQINNGLGATQFYASLGVSATDPNLFVGGLQDNGVVRFNGTTWSTYPGSYGDGAACVISPANDNNILASGDARNFYYSSNRGSTTSNVLSYLGGTYDSRTAFVAPVAISKKKPSVVYVGTDNLSKSTTGGASWLTTAPYTSSTPTTNYIEALHKTAVAMAVSPSDPNGDTLYVSTSPFAQYDNDVDNIYINGKPNLLKSTNGGATLPMTSIKGSLPDRFVMDVAISPTYRDSVFIVLGGFGTSHVYVSGDGGATWNPIGNGLPDAPFNAILLDPVDPQVIYAGGDMGVYVSTDRGTTWYDYNTGFWDVVPVMDIQPTADNQLVVATHGKGAFKGPRYSNTGSMMAPSVITTFTGSSANGTNTLTWTTQNENSQKQYEVEKSADGFTYQSIAIVAAHNGNGTQHYTYNDAAGARSGQNLYYRLKAIRSDGSARYSWAVIIKGNPINSFTVLTNPFTDRLQIRCGLSQPQKVLVNVYDAAGGLVRQETYKGEIGSNTFTVTNMSRYSKGIYIVEAVAGKLRYTQKVQKQ